MQRASQPLPTSLQGSLHGSLHGSSALLAPSVTSVASKGKAPNGPAGGHVAGSQAESGLERPPLLRRTGFWLWRYLPQDVAACLAAAVTAWTLSRTHDVHGARTVALACTLVEIATFYAVSYARARRVASPRVALQALIGEYGPAELADLFVRPTAMALGVRATTDPVLGVLLGGLVADLGFYALAAASHARATRSSRATRG